MYVKEVSLWAWVVCRSRKYFSLSQSPPLRGWGTAKQLLPPQVPFLIISPFLFTLTDVSEVEISKVCPFWGPKKGEHSDVSWPREFVGINGNQASAGARKGRKFEGNEGRLEDGVIMGY